MPRYYPYMRSVSSPSKDGMVGGCIFIPTYSGKQLNTSVPSVYVSEVSDVPYEYCIIHSGKKAVYEITKRLITRGKRRFAFAHLASPQTNECYSFSVDRYQGMLDALNDEGVSYNMELTRLCPYCPNGEGDNTYEAATEVMTEYAQMPEDKRPDAIICSTDAIALACMHTLQKAGIRIPEDVAVAGFDNSPLISYSSPQITSVQNPYWEFGSEAAKMLISVMRGEISGGRRLMLNAVIIERGSTDASLK